MTRGKQPLKRKAKGQIWQEDKITRSGLETNSLKILHKLQVGYEYEPKDKKIKYQKLPTSHTYLPDIMIDGWIYELKGYFSAENRKKMVDVMRCNPDLKLTMVFMTNNPIRKGSKTRYLDWCKKEGIDAIMFDQFEQTIKQRHK